MIRDGSPRRASRWGSRALVLTVAALVVLVAVIALGVQAIRGNRIVGVQRDALTIHNAALDNAYYHCLDVQTRSLITPDQPVLFDTNLGNLVTLLKAVGSWVTIADPPSTAVAKLSLRANASGDGSCLGTVVVATYAKPEHGVRVRIGSGASVPGNGPVPAPPL